MLNSLKLYFPHADIVQNARCLNHGFLCEQIDVARTVMNYLEEHPPGWDKHPAVMMFHGYRSTLAKQYNCYVNEAGRRGFGGRWRPVTAFWPLVESPPPWWGDYLVHDSHKAYLLRRCESYYKRFGWDVDKNFSMIWPTWDWQRKEAKMPVLFRGGL